MAKQYILKNIRALLTVGFDTDDLRSFCYDEPGFRPVYHKIAQEASQKIVVDRLIRYAEQHLKLDILLAWAKENNPTQYEHHQPYAVTPASADDVSKESEKAIRNKVVARAAKPTSGRRKTQDSKSAERITVTVSPGTTTARRQARPRQQASAQLEPVMPFGNRKPQLKPFEEGKAPPYHLVDALAGCGKTKFLLELKRVLSKQGWICAYVCADDFPTCGELIQGLAKELGLQQPLTDGNAKDLGAQLGVQVRKDWERHLTRKGLILLIDLGGATSSDLVKELIEFIPEVYDNFQVEEPRSPEQQRFSVVLAGRHLASKQDKLRTISSLPLTVEQLPPLAYPDLYKLTRAYLPKRTKVAIVTEIATRIMHITGGHPACMVALLKMYQQSGRPAARAFFEINAAAIQDVIDREIGQIQQDIPGELQGVIKVLGIFRQVNLYILSFLRQQGYIVGYDNPQELEDKLTMTYYLRRDGPLLRNDNHRLLGLRRREDPQYAHIAQQSCEDYLVKKIPARRPEVWVIEYLYQFLQRFSGEINSANRRAEIQAALLHTELPHILDILVAHMDGDDRKDTYETLKKELKEDEEFRFVVNYYTGADQYSKDPYNNEPYTQLERAIDQFFHNRG
jgi:hypothetical protein